PRELARFALAAGVWAMSAFALAAQPASATPAAEPRDAMRRHPPGRFDAPGRHLGRPWHLARRQPPARAPAFLVRPDAAAAALRVARPVRHRAAPALRRRRLHRPGRWLRPAMECHAGRQADALVVVGPRR